ncbi:hypothetical protein [Mesoflavibacter sp. CH_XMU1422-2]|uniref:hypothetical protein n=1 Tax=Mesoflavibacter sp. CH_XMU1422-2 TaxID=3107770 RepID=UPI00300AC0AB
MNDLSFGYIEPETCIERRFGESSTNEYLAIPKEDIYNPDLVFSDNFTDERDKYLVLKIAFHDDSIKNLIPDQFSKCLSTPQKLNSSNISYLRTLVHDYDTIFGTRYPNFRNYNPRFFSCEERVLFETLIIKFKQEGFKTFRWEKSKIGYELGIKRGKRNTIINRFKNLGIIKSAISKSCKAEKGRNANSYFFNLDCSRILELIPEIFSEYNRKEVEHDLYKYLAPAFKKD